MIKELYFWDGNLYEFPFPESTYSVTAIDGEVGFTQATQSLKEAKNSTEDCAIVTNCPFLLSFETVGNIIELTSWEQSRKILDRVFLYNTDKHKWRPIQEFTERELHFPHNLEKMYRNGEFQQEASLLRKGEQNEYI